MGQLKITFSEQIDTPGHPLPFLKNGRRGPIFTYPKKHHFSANSVYFENWYAEIHTFSAHFETIFIQFLAPGTINGKNEQIPVTLLCTEAPP